MRKVLVAVVIALLLAMVASPAAYAKETECTSCYYRVRPGDTLFSIGRMYGVSPWAIASHNGIVNPNHIYVGQMLAIPCCGGGWGWPYPSWCTCRYYHTVGWGENLFRISLRYHVNMWHIARCNGIHNLNYIQVGRTLCIP